MSFAAVATRRDSGLRSPQVGLRADITAPSPNHVLLTFVAAWQNDGNGEQGSTAYVLHSADRGETWGQGAPISNGYGATSVPLTLETTRTSGMLIEAADGRSGSHLATNRAGKACLSYADYDLNVARGETHYVRCSSDGGATWGSAIAAVTGRPQDLARPQIAV